METRLADSFRTARGLADGIAVSETAPRRGQGERITFSENFACPVSGFHHPGNRAAAVFLQRALRGLPGLRRHGDGAVLRRTAGGAGCGAVGGAGAIAPWAKSKSAYLTQTVNALAKFYGFDHARPRGRTCRNRCT